MQIWISPPVDVGVIAQTVFAGQVCPPAQSTKHCPCVAPCRM
jgi:hypothetical protein